MQEEVKALKEHIEKNDLKIKSVASQLEMHPNWISRIINGKQPAGKYTLMLISLYLKGDLN